MMGGGTVRAFAVAACLASQLQAAGGALQSGDLDQVTHMYDLRSILAADAPVLHDLNTMLHKSSAWLECLEPETYDPGLGDHASLDAAEIVDLLKLASRGADGDARFDVRSGWLRVLATAEGHEVVVEAVELLRSAAQESIEVEVYRLDDDRIPIGTPAILDLRSAETLLGAVDDTLVCRQTIPLGRNVRVGDGAIIAYLSDEDLEGWWTHACDPTVSIVRAGLELGVRVDRASDGESFVVRGWGRDGGPLPAIDASRTEGRVPRTIETLTVPTSQFIGSAILPPGGALLLDHDGGHHGAVIVRIRSAVDGGAPDGLTPLGMLALPPFRRRPPLGGEAEPSSGLLYWLDDSALDEWCSDNETLRRHYEGPGRAPDQPGLPPKFGSSALSGLPGYRDGASREALDGLRTCVQIRTVALEVRYDLVERGGLESVVDEETLDVFAASAGGRLLGTAIDGDSLVLVGGRERAYLHDLDIQISNSGTSPPDPTVSAIFEGVSLWFAPVLRPNGSVAAGIQFRMRRSPGEFRSIETSTYLAEVEKKGRLVDGFVRSHPIRLPRVQRADSRTMIDAPPGQWTLVTARPLAGSGETLVVVARMDVH